ncbi:MAG: hypothetical protein MPEBLZ_01625 [Candidatus Methanoperedens nitroreducens]|uniref:Uncharacterized protein n=1 Tax=Candidatus Methanoperedens nitratireducens TaxID=1392998 RepID=A0A0P7ZG14_9EURY|nr:MAG: hypothetical protein MPEBLZ_01625 [Candidatus Methanoperedens sp. BLZ1]
MEHALNHPSISLDKIHIIINEKSWQEEFGSVSMETIMDTTTRVFLAISLLGSIFSIVLGAVTSIRQIIDSLFLFIKNVLKWLFIDTDGYFKE